MIAKRSCLIVLGLIPLLTSAIATSRADAQNGPLAESTISRLTEEWYQLWLDETIAKGDTRYTQLQDLYRQLVADFAEGSRIFREASNQRRARQREEDGRAAEVRQRVEPPSTASLARGWHRRRFELDRQFEHDVDKLLTPNERPSWSNLSRDVRRLQLLPWLGGPFLTLFADLSSAIDALFEDQSLADGLAELVVQYEDAIDEHLRRHEDALADGSNSGEKERRVIRDIHIATADYTALLSDALPQHLKSEFHRLVYGELFPRMFEPTAAHMLFEELKEQQVSPEQRAAAQDEADRFFADLAELDGKLLMHMGRQLAMSRQQSEKARQEYLEWRDADSDEPYRVRHNDVSRLWERRHDLVVRACRETTRLFSEERRRAFPPHIRLLLEWHEID